MKRLLKWFALAIGVFLALAVVVLVVSLLVYPAEYVQRAALWMEADVYDYQRFPERGVQAAERPFLLTEAPDEAGVQQVFNTMLVGYELDSFLESTGTQAFLVLHGDRLLYEKYFNGSSRETIVTSFSVAKSFTSALIGIAIEEGYIRSVEDAITDYLPELAERDPRFAEIRIRNLLEMSSGIHYAEFFWLSGDDGKTYYYPDLRALAIKQTWIEGSPGEAFLYNNYHPLLLGMILERATGQHVADYLASRIWQPMGAQYDASWSLDSEDGFEKMESGINARAIDFAKFGLLFLNEGRSWLDEQIVPLDWVRVSTASATLHNDDYYPQAMADSGGSYAWMWWGMQVEPYEHAYFAAGNHGQFIFVCPADDLIIARFGEQYGTEHGAWISLFYEFCNQFNPLND